MITQNLNSRVTQLGLITAFSASLCCVTPILAMISGIGGIAGSFAWMEPIRPYLIASSLGLLGVAWYHKLKPTSEPDCDCQPDQVSLWQSKTFLVLVTLVTGLLLALPSYSGIFFPNNPINSVVAVSQDSVNQVTLDVQGMTCAGCEDHVEQAVGSLEGVTNVEASFSSGSAFVAFDPSQTTVKEITEAISSTGYRVRKTGASEKPATSVDPETIGFYRVPLVCNAAPNLGCGSRAKPILLELEGEESVNEAWLNRNGTVIAIKWGDHTDLQTRRNVVTRAFATHKVNASELLMEDFESSLQSFASGGGWYRGSDVDELSKKEADVLADKVMKPLFTMNLIDSTSAQPMREEIAAIWADWFLNLEDVSELSDPVVYKKIEERIFKVGESYLGQGKMPEVKLFSAQCKEATCKKDGTCCSNKAQ